MKKFILIVYQVLLFPLPWILRRSLLNFLPGFSIGPKSKIGRSILIANRVILEEGAKITNLSFVNSIDKLHMKAYSKIGRSNWITGANSSSKMFRDSNRTCELVVGVHTRITGQHHIDCTGGVNIGDFTTVAGIRSQILSHSVDVKQSKQVAGPVKIGKYCFVGTSAILLMGSSLPDCSVLGAGAVLNKNYNETYSLYAGNPARKVKTFEKEEYKYFNRDHGHVG
jgi:acetyltransferase-like isoleucine patch superfamily enzyme